MTTGTAICSRAIDGTHRDILEYAASPSAHQVDRGRGLIHNVKVLGSRSRNGGVYSTPAMAAARPLYEGVRVNIDHPNRATPEAERSFGDWFGVLENVRLLADGLYGDLAYLTSHPLAEQICEAAERFPGSFGLSHNARVTESAQEGQLVYDTIHRVRSVDIVCKPATTRGIFESEEASMALRRDGDVLCDDPQDLSAVPPEPEDQGVAVPDGDFADSGELPDSVDWEALLDQLRAVYESGDSLAARVHEAIKLVGQSFLEAAAADSTSDDASARQETLTDQADHGLVARRTLESLRAAPRHGHLAVTDTFRPRSDGGRLPDSTTARAARAARWADPKVCALALLSR